VYDLDVGGFIIRGFDHLCATVRKRGSRNNREVESLYEPEEDERGRRVFVLGNTKKSILSYVAATFSPPKMGWGGGGQKREGGKWKAHDIPIKKKHGKKHGKKGRGGLSQNWLQPKND